MLMIYNPINSHSMVKKNELAAFKGWLLKSSTCVPEVGCPPAAQNIGKPSNFDRKPVMDLNVGYLDNKQ